ncbi:MAG: SEC-C domain-containing protein [Alphaproteobacteria bacterium]|nr:SEC-C domain-containing protein [Alphaproteobacteria bacterium]
MKISRNQPCPCGSNKKYKRCCGSPLKEQITSPNILRGELPPEIFSALERHKADELIRQQQQGLGRPIISMNMKGHKIVAAGNTLYHSPKWKTVPDFLSDYLCMVLGSEWGNSEIQKPLTARHPILQWYDSYCQFQRSMPGGPDVIKSAPMTGVVYCYLGLAYSLFLLKHNVELQDRLIKRLKDPSNFQGAYYELIVANTLIRAGFDLALEDETDGLTKHCEFSAVSKKTKKKYWVEAKMRSVQGILGKTEYDGTKKPDATSELIKHLNAALKKPATDERFIFIDLNTEPFDGKTKPIWVERAAKKLETREKNCTSEDRAYVFVTNIPFHRTLESEHQGHAILAHGFGIADFARPGAYRLSEKYRRKQKHIDAHDILEAFRKYPQIPPTFDGNLPSNTYGKPYDRLIIGETYHFNDIGENGIIGMVTSACVLENEKTIYCSVSTADGKSCMLRQPMSDEALSDYKAHPESFFGKIQHVGRNTEDPYELFEFFMESYQATPKDRLLEFMRDAYDFSALQQMEQSDLAMEYCERCVVSIVNRNAAQKTSR